MSDRQHLFVFVVCLIATASMTTKNASGQLLRAAPATAVQSENAYQQGLLMSLNNNPLLANELQLSDQQKTDLKKASEKLRQQQQELYQQYQEGVKIGEQQTAQLLYREGNEKMRADFAKELEEVLLAHQMTRLSQISRQQMVRYRGWNNGPRYSQNADSLNLPLQLSEELELTPEEVHELESKVTEVRAEMEKKIEELKDKAMKEVLGELTRDQQNKLQELIGTPFDFSASQRAQQREMSRQAQERTQKAQADPVKANPVKTDNS
jgi:Skp family chaperone for outer membrane proteins